MTAKDTPSGAAIYRVFGVWAFGRVKLKLKTRSPDGSASVTNVAPHSRQMRRVNARNSNDTRVSLDPQCLQATSCSGASQWIIRPFGVSNLDAVGERADLQGIYGRPRPRQSKNYTVCKTRQLGDNHAL